jgi:hypothetical protein
MLKIKLNVKTYKNFYFIKILSILLKISDKSLFIA